MTCTGPRFSKLADFVVVSNIFLGFWVGTELWPAQAQCSERVAKSLCIFYGFAGLSVVTELWPAPGHVFRNRYTLSQHFENTFHKQIPTSRGLKGISAGQPGWRPRTRLKTTTLKQRCKRHSVNSCLSYLTPRSDRVLLYGQQRFGYGKKTTPTLHYTTYCALTAGCYTGTLSGAQKFHPGRKAQCNAWVQQSTAASLPDIGHMTAASYIKTLSALHPRPAFKRRALRLSATWRSILFFLMACNQCGNNNSARKKQFPPAWHSSFLRSFSDFSSFSSNACMAILFLNNIQKKLFAEAFKVLDFATPILGVQKPAKPRSSNCGLPSSCAVVRYDVQMQQCKQGLNLHRLFPELSGAWLRLQYPSRTPRFIVLGVLVCLPAFSIYVFWAFSPGQHLTSIARQRICYISA